MPNELIPTTTLKTPVEDIAEAFSFVLTEPSREQKAVLRTKSIDVAIENLIFHPPGTEWALKKAKLFKKRVEGVRLSSAQEGLSYIYGFSGFHALRKSVDSQDMAPVFDEDLDAESLERRLSFQAYRIHEFFAIDLVSSRELIDIFRPSARQRSRPLHVENFDEQAEDERIWRWLNSKGNS